MGLTPDQINDRFAYHAPSPQDVVDHGDVREMLGTVAYRLASMLPDGREAALVMTHLEEAMFWANAAIARAPEDASGPGQPAPR